MHIVDVVLVGCGGYGEVYLHPLLDQAAEYGAGLVAVVSRNADDVCRIEELRARNIPVFGDLECCLDQCHADLVVISTPIHLHAKHMLQALAAGAHVLCEKPLGGSVEEGLEVIAAAKKAGRFAAIGYQWSFTDAVQRLKQDLMAGRFGKPIRFRSLMICPRTSAYYARNEWAGKKSLSTGDAVLDSSANNGCAHFLHNMFFLLGDVATSSAYPVTVQSELYRAKPIDYFDTCAIRCMTGDGVEILFYASHSVEQDYGPVFSLECELAEVVMDQSGCIEAHFKTGEVVSYGEPGPEIAKLWKCVKAARTGSQIDCTAEAALAKPWPWLPQIGVALMCMIFLPHRLNPSILMAAQRGLSKAWPML